MNRRKFVRNSLAATMGAGVALGGYSWQIEPFWLEIVRRPMSIANLPDHLVGKSLMQISDMHVGDRFDWSYIIDSFDQVRSIQPDIVVYTGDFVSYESTDQLDQLSRVMDHAVRGRLGTLGILGNHDYGHNWSQDKVADQISSICAAADVQVLRNKQTQIDGLNIIGLDDLWATNFDPNSVMKAHAKDQANLVLCHNPDVCDLDVWHGYDGWILAGHTHGGQCKPPFLPAPLLPVKNKRYSSGEIALDDGRTLYINRALGHLWQVRFNVRPEITIFELQRAEE